MTKSRLVLLTLLAMIAFAGNSILCRFALKQTSIDAASFTSIRLFSGAIALFLISYYRAFGQKKALGEGAVSRFYGGDWKSGVTLFIYASTFSFAYSSLITGTGALLLFGAVQVTMIVAGWWTGERLILRQVIGLLLALAGLVVMVLPGLSAPPLVGATLMLMAGIAWGIYSLLGRRVADSMVNPVATTTGNFLRATPFAFLLSIVMIDQFHFDPWGIFYAVLSGAITSGVGYVLWYAALRGLTATRAASVQLMVPVLAAVGGSALLSEPVSLRLMISCVAILGGIALVLLRTRPTR